MISKKVSKERNKKVLVNSVNTENTKKLITRSRSLIESLVSGGKQTKPESKSSAKSVESKRNKPSINKRINDKNDKKLVKSSHSLKTNDKNSTKKERKNSYKKSTKVKKIKEIVKKVKTKTTNKLRKVVKRKLRTNSKYKVEKEKQKMKNTNKSKNCKQNSDTKISSIRDNERLNHKIVSKPSTKCNSNSSSNICSKLFPTLNCIKSSNSSKSVSKKCDNNSIDSKTKFKSNSKTYTKNIKKEKNSEKIKPKTKSTKVQKNKSNSSSKKANKTVKNKKQKVKQKINNKSIKTKTNTKSGKKFDKNNEQKKKITNGPSVGRGHRLASLNAIAKVRLLCESETEKNDSMEESTNKSNFKQMVKKEKIDKKSENNKSNSKQTKKVNNCKALVAVDNSRKQLAVKKRKLIDDSIEIIDTRSCKRMASLNASAMMAASYLPEIRNKSIELNPRNGSMEMVREMKTISQTVSRIEISPTVNGINGVHVNQVSQQNVILSAQKHETIETVKQLKVSNKIKDRLIGIARIEQQNQKTKQKGKSVKSGNSDEEDDSLVLGGEVSGFQATKVQVTKVTHINTSKDKTNGHKIDSILERDSSVVHKYQVQTKSTIEMQTTFNSGNGSGLANVTTITAPQQMANTCTATRAQVNLCETPAQVVPVPILSSNSGQPTYFNFAGAAPIVQFHNNSYQTMASSASGLNPMSIINLSEPYPTHYSSAFSVPHFATHTHPQQTPFNYFHAGLYQPAGPLLQPFQDPCLIHKPIPFHPPAPQMTHIQHNPQFSNPTIQTQTPQTFQNEMNQTFTSTPQYFHPLPTPMRPSQTVYFQTLPQTSSSLGPNPTTFAFLNPGLHYTHPSVINSGQPFATHENPVLNTETTYLNTNPNKMNTNITTGNMSSTSESIPVPNQTLNDNYRQHMSKSIQCSPQSRDNYQTVSENHCDSSDGSLRTPHRTGQTSITRGGPEVTKRVNKTDHKSDKRKKSLLLNPNSSQKSNEMVITLNNHSPDLRAGHQSQTQMSGTKNLKNALTPSNKTNSINKSSPHQKNSKTVSIEVNTSLPSVSVPSTPSPSLRLMPFKKTNKKRNSHGWSWEGKPTDKYVYLNNEEHSYLRKCYPSIRHNEGDIIRVRDCVLLRSGPRKTDLPFVAKIAALWESPEGEMMMSLLWYYRPEHTDLEFYSNEMLGEIFASKHRDTNSVACIDDKCYVLTYNEFCRYKRLKLLKNSILSTSLTSATVPAFDESYPRAERMPPTRVFPELVFCCRKVYDYRQKCILKNPI